MRRLKASGKRVLVLSNAPRRAAAVAAGMVKLGLGPELYDAVLSSGEITWRALAERTDPWHARLGRRCFHVGPARDLSMLEGNDLVPAATIEEAEFVLVTGPRDDSLDVADHEEMLMAARRRELKMVCANPDREVLRGESRLVCAGALAERYRELGGEVRTHGKPFASIYDAALVLLGHPPRDKVLAVGDGLHTDIAGAVTAGFDSGFIAGGIHGRALGARMGEAPPAHLARRLADEFGLVPTYFLPELRW
jgi:HAD superfamily hydrolase (TIGR01459 family)